MTANTPKTTSFRRREGRMVRGILANRPLSPSRRGAYHDHVRTRLVASVVVALILAVSCTHGTDAPRDPRVQAPAGGVAVEPLVRAPALDEAPERSEAIVATARVERVKVFRRPEAPQPFIRLEHPNRFGTPTVFLVDEMNGRWLRAYLPMRPNEVQGWIRRGDVRLSSTPYRIQVDVGDNRLTVWKGDRKIMVEPVAVGTGGTPTPTGQFFVSLLAEFPDTSVYGPFALGLSAYSEVYQSFGGGDGQVAIHGTNDPSSIGLDISHGCIRLPNEAILELSRRLSLGTPVRIRP
jgi:lipoprotein-anchoring transpeptidase ErfK/SrfK